MKQVIYKFSLQIMGGVQSIFMKEGSEILSLQEQHGVPTIWVKFPVDDDSSVERKFMMHGTGHESEDMEGTFIGTVQINGFVWHYFEVV